MSYIGNTSLSPQIQERILNTFEQTLSLAEQGNRQEALLGCDFILRLDPLFEPARRLQERLKQSEGSIDVHEFMTFGRAPAAAASPGGVDTGLELEEAEQPAEVDWELEAAEADSLAAMDVDLETAEPKPSHEAPTTSAVASALALHFEQRNFQELLQLAQDNQELVVADAKLRQLVETATARLESEPYVKNFLESAQTAKDLGDLASAQAHLEKARELDPSHPGIAALETDLSSKMAVETPSAVVVDPSPMEELIDLESESVPMLDVEPSAHLDSDSEQRIETLLDEGQSAFEAGEYQSAIDAWSRIFLIDIDHSEANRRIELARKLKAEVERQVEEAFHEAIGILESGDLDGAREAFHKVLEMQSNHMGARDYLKKLEAGDLGGEVVEQAAAPRLPLEPPAPIDEAEAVDMLDDGDLAAQLPDEAYPVAEEAPEVDHIPAARPLPKRRSFALIGSSVLVVVLVVAWFVYSEWDRIFPASATQDIETAQPQVDPLERARELHRDGNTAMAINVLRRLPPRHRQYAEAQSLIATWEAGDVGQQVAADTPDEAVLARRAAFLQEARESIQGGENLRALELIEQAAAIFPLDEEETEIRLVAVDMLEDVNRELELFEQGDWDYALPNLWKLHEADPQNRDVVRLMVDSYYNLGLRDLQRGDPKAAVEKFDEALELYPEDEGVKRLLEFANSYHQRPSDLLYRIFVKYQHFR